MISPVIEFIRFISVTKKFQLNATNHFWTFLFSVVSADMADWRGRGRGILATSTASLSNCKAGEYMCRFTSRAVMHDF
jgi:hypothetical protein